MSALVLQQKKGSRDIGDGLTMGAATEGGWGTCTPSSEFRGDVPPEIAIFTGTFLNIYRKVGIFRYFRNKVGEIRGEI